MPVVETRDQTTVGPDSLSPSLSIFSFSPLLLLDNGSQYMHWLHFPLLLYSFLSTIPSVPLFSVVKHFLPSCHFLMWTATPFHFPLPLTRSLDYFPIILLSIRFLPFSSCLTEVSWKTPLAHSSLSDRKPHPSFCGRGRGYDSCRPTHTPVCCMATEHVHTQHTLHPSFPPYSAHFPPHELPKSAHHL